MAHGRSGSDQLETTSLLPTKFLLVQAVTLSSSLQKSGIPEIQGYGTFPVSGHFLRTDNPELVKQHSAKVYSQAAVGAPPMSVPHLDTRIVDGKPSLLFGPFAGINPKFLKKGLSSRPPLICKA
jgi:L-2-hydroxyglutarate oxidase LhgO